MMMVFTQVFMAAERPRISGGMISSFRDSNGVPKEPTNAAMHMSARKVQTLDASG